MKSHCNRLAINYDPSLILNRGALSRIAAFWPVRRNRNVDGSGKIFRSAALLLTGALVILLLSDEQAASQFLSRDHPLSANEIKIGMSNAQTGRSAWLGTEIRLGCEACFAKVNKTGGVAGRRLTLVDYDDHYEPVETVSNTEHLIDEDKVFALLDFLGTPTCRAILPMVNEADIVLVGPISGASIFRQPMQRLIFNTRASYGEEAETLVTHLVADVGCKKFALFRQDDSFGDAGRVAVVEALRRRGLTLVSEGTYVRNSVNAPEALYRIAKAKPDAVILFGTYKPCANLIRGAKQLGMKNTAFCNVSVVGTEPLIKYLAEDGNGVIISQVVPSPYDDTLPLVRDYRADVRSIGSTDYSYMGLEGYLNSVVLVDALRRAGRDLTEDSLIAALEHLSVDFGTFGIHFSPETRQGTHQVFLTKVDHGRAIPIEKIDSADFAQ
ncbi:MAG: ABC transporter substrate-binding protein [Verrucomicrobia bacterium]|nr:ABC transporter substrate-binding protein [Verrucomicrobiota bacterium]MBV8376697.1 ABC transporter substrate-binding protein [Verrucomicrobiota bacterium]